jgi:hypothetical protein
VDLEVYVRNVEGTRLSEDVKPTAEVTFNVNATITETERNQGQISLKFSIDMESEPAVAKLVVAGSATLLGEEQEIDALLMAKDADATPPIFMKIYEKVYAVLYLLCGSLKIPYPSPALLKVVQVSSGSEAGSTQSSRDGAKSISA